MEGSQLFSPSPALLIIGREPGWYGRVSGSEENSRESVLCGISSEGLVRSMKDPGDYVI